MNKGRLVNIMDCYCSACNKRIFTVECHHIEGEKDEEDKEVFIIVKKDGENGRRFKAIFYR